MNGKFAEEEQPVATRTRRLSKTSTTNSLNAKKNSPVNNVKERPPSDRVLRGQTDSSSRPRVVTIDEIVIILEKEESMRSSDDLRVLREWSLLVPEAKARVRSKKARRVLKQRAIEQEESIESIEAKVDTLVELIENAKCVVIYTGAGISTSASIPDYRGPNGLWTQIRRKGTFSISKFHDLSTAEPTLTHMAIKELCKRRVVNHIVSQNCDGLHLRSGIPQAQLSEIHGNMFIEVCPTCEKQYYRQADVTDKTSRFRHKTGRKCHTCAEPNNNLIDTIVLFGERSRTQWPMNWERAGKAAKLADLIICMGSSLKTLVRYHCLWPKRGRKFGNKDSETKLVIINLQYTSKDDSAVLKITGRCDTVMKLVMQKLNINIPSYDWSDDPLLRIAIPFTPDERTNLKRNLIFEVKARQANSKRNRCELSTSPGLFVSEITDDPSKKKLKMRIRAMNGDDTNSNSSATPTPTCLSEAVAGQPKESAEGAGDIDDSPTATDQFEEGENAELETTDDGYGPMNESDRLKYALPGWLGKSLGNKRTSSYRRKRHGNKGRKHCSTAKESLGDSLVAPAIIKTEP